MTETTAQPVTMREYRSLIADIRQACGDPRMTAEEYNHLTEALRLPDGYPVTGELAACWQRLRRKYRAGVQYWEFETIEQAGEPAEEVRE